MYIVTNATVEGNYTPSIFKSFNEAQKWMIECAASNILRAFSKELDNVIYSDVKDLERRTKDKYEEARNILSFAALNIDGVKIQKDKIVIDYSDGNFNILELFEVEG